MYGSSITPGRSGHGAGRWIKVAGGGVNATADWRGTVEVEGTLSNI